MTDENEKRASEIEKRASEIANKTREDLEKMFDELPDKDEYIFVWFRNEGLGDDVRALAVMHSNKLAFEKVPILLREVADHMAESIRQMDKLPRVGSKTPEAA